jgi:hypothetical protein
LDLADFPPGENVTVEDPTDVVEGAETQEVIAPENPCIRHEDREATYGGKFCASCRSGVWAILKSVAKKSSWADLTKNQQAWFLLGPDVYENHPKVAEVYAEAFRLGQEHLTDPKWQALFNSRFAQAPLPKMEPVLAPEPEEPENVFPLRASELVRAPTPERPGAPSSYGALRAEVALLREKLDDLRAQQVAAFREEFPEDVEQLLRTGKVSSLPGDVIYQLARELEGPWKRIYAELAGSPSSVKIDRVREG